MRVYHIYRQELKYHINDFDYWKSTEEWRQPEYVGWCYGTRELYNFFKGFHLYTPWIHKTIVMVNEFHEPKIEMELGTYHPTVCYMIVDNLGRVRDLYELTEQYVKKRQGYKHSAYQSRNGMHIKSELRQKSSKEDDKMAKSEYAITLKSKSMRKRWNNMSWDFNYGGKKSKSWKDQSKRKKQYKNKAERRNFEEVENG